MGKLHWPFIEKLGRLLEKGLKASAVLGAREVQSQLIFQEELEGVIPRRALDFFKINAFEIAHVENKQLTDRIKARMEQALQEGTTLREFQKGLPELFGNYGVSPLKPWHIKTVFQTNLQEAYQAGRYWGIMQTDGDMFPYVEYHAVGDEATRPEHMALDGKIFKRDDPLLDTLWPPNGFNCRCTMTAVTKFEAEEEGIIPTPKGELVNPATGRAYQPPEGFNRNPAQSLSIYDWWQERMGSNLMATPATYGFYAIPVDPALPLGKSMPPEKYQALLLERTGGNIPNFEGVNIPLSPEALTKLSREDKQYYLEHMLDTVKNPREVWAVPGKDVTMRYLKVFGDYETLISVEVGEGGLRDVMLNTGLVRERGKKPRKQGYLEQYRKGVLVYVRQ